MFMPMNVVPDDKLEAIRKIAEKPNNFYYGSFRSFFSPTTLETFEIDTRYDDDLRAAGFKFERRGNPDA